MKNLQLSLSKLRGMIRGSALIVREKLFKVRVVPVHAASRNNDALIEAATFGRFDILNRLLDISEVVTHAAGRENLALTAAANNGHIAIVKRLLEVPCVREESLDLDDKVIKQAAGTGHDKVVRELVKAKWPEGGVQGIPAEMRARVLPNISRAHGTLFAARFLEKIYQLGLSIESSYPRRLIIEFLNGERDGLQLIQVLLTMQKKSKSKQVKSESNVFTGKDEEFTIKHK